MGIADKKPLSIESPILVLVEGLTDKELLDSHLLKHDSLVAFKDKFTIHAAGNYEKIGNIIENIKLMRGFHHLQILAVIADADDSPSSRSEEVDSWYLPLSDESFVKKRLLLPSDTETGALESLILKTLSEQDLACATIYIDCVASNASLNKAQRDKLKLYAWTSQQQKEPVTNFMRVKSEGERVIDINHAAFDPIVLFLKSLVESCSPKS